MAVTVRFCKTVPVTSGFEMIDPCMNAPGLPGCARRSSDPIRWPAPAPRLQILHRVLDASVLIRPIGRNHVA